MKILALVTFFVVVSPGVAQNVTCTPDVPGETCKKASVLFAMPQIKSQIVIADPGSFQSEQESLTTRIKKGIEMGLSWHNPSIPNSRSEEILFVRDDKTCPTRVVISTDAFRPVRVAESAKVAKVERVEGFDLAAVLHVAHYVEGFVEGCNMGHLTYLSDESWKLRK